MSDGSTSTTGFNWSVEGGGAVSVSGLYTAPSTSQETPATITATKGGKTGTATVQSVFEPATIEAKANITGKVGGSTTAFTTMFTATNSVAEDYSFVVSPTSAGSVSTAGVFTLSNNASGTVTVKATHKTQIGVEATVTFTGVTAKATITGKTVTGKIGEDTVTFAEMFTSNKPASEFNYVVTPNTNTSMNVNTGLLTLTNNASGNYEVKATHKVQTSVTATANVNGVVPKPDIRASELPPQVGGSLLNFGVMFLFGNSSPSDYTVTITPAEAGTIDPADGDVTLALDPGDEMISVKAVHKTVPSVQATCSFTATPKLMGLVASKVTNTVVVGVPENPLATDTITITDPAQPGVVRFDGVPQGALTGKLMYDVEGTDAGLMELSLSGQVLTITLSAPITSEDTKVTMRTDPASTIFRTYIVKSGA
ncbi:hypothetical protein MEDNBIBF_00003 [Escherichia phage SR02]|uniref:Uncharacterized protein n=1 Tax=Escherichia phage SR02 TaxID=3056226 RepID=A0AA50F0I3_9CAUD|nr:hypothetical protein MEDNBIBF_00003 [Escherichia phage SR02]